MIKSRYLPILGALLLTATGFAKADPQISSTKSNKELITYAEAGVDTGNLRASAGAGIRENGYGINIFGDYIQQDSGDIIDGSLGVEKFIKYRGMNQLFANAYLGDKIIGGDLGVARHLLKNKKARLDAVFGGYVFSIDNEEKEIAAGIMGKLEVGLTLTKKLGGIELLGSVTGVSDERAFGDNNLLYFAGLRWPTHGKDPVRRNPGYILEEEAPAIPLEPQIRQVSRITPTPPKNNEIIITPTHTDQPGEPPTHTDQE